MLAKLVFLLCAVTSVACATLLFVSYRQLRSRLVLWCSVCFIALACNNIMLYADAVVYAHLELPWLVLGRNVVALVGSAFLLLELSKGAP